MNRNAFLKSVGQTGILIATTPLVSFANPLMNDPQLDKEIVQKFVGAGHGNFDVVKELLEEYPTLLNAAHDWKFGDFETALGAASHVGNKEIATYLIEKGAQVNIFTATLFGKMEILKPIIEAFPSSLNAKGPHGFTLLHHAIKGGDDALEVKEYLINMGAKEVKVPLY
ncbi:ankyrin repeat domain-containing protein [Aureisphaera sp. CAU 1614]|uniref:Ankyrin repeat domain-containing protein n=1 Tax=Halomarinibacterium sedimenti TaxID=2857106 RepID=A0A9X1JZ27_9FLAO|nr:ankyrin repeat domain-containing protein [Halomarinibacterium sedimenti]MBW2938132.1 ankyrin repeat domain-containing protein [Halomarinibacterium sedimenti]